MDRAGYDGAVAIKADVHVSAGRAIDRSMRARPGTFEWRYARELNKKGGDGALFYAGGHFAVLWEKAGIADGGTVDWARVGSSGWKGLPDGRAAAIDRVQQAEREIGMLASARLRAYCVRGQTTAEIARAFSVSERDMAAALKLDLIAAAVHFRYM